MLTAKSIYQMILFSVGFGEWQLSCLFLEKDLARQFAGSRITGREIIQILETEGFFIHRSRIGPTLILLVRQKIIDALKVKETWSRLSNASAFENLGRSPLED